MNVSTAFTITRGNRRDSYDVVILLEVEQRGIEYREYHPIYIKKGCYHRDGLQDCHEPG